MAVPSIRGTFLDNLDAFLAATGVENAKMAWDFAELPWQTDSQRDEFISGLTQPKGT
jgi:hypothetical protein